MTFDYLKGGDDNAQARIFNGASKSRVQRADNENKRASVEMIANPGKALCDAVVENDIVKFNMVLAHRRNTPRAINRAFFMAVGFERDQLQ